MSDLDRPEAWNARYEEDHTPWDVGGPAPPLLRMRDREDLVPPGSDVAFVGCGRGWDAVAWARAGHRVTGFDFAPRALEEARALAREAGVADRCTFEQADVLALADDPPGPFDVCCEYTCFCAIRPERRLDYARGVTALLRPGGRLVGLFFPVEEKEGGPPFAVDPSEVRELLARVGGFEVIHEEMDPGDSVEPRAGREWLAVLRRT